MTIKEMEERSGMTRANIRFYETEGLLHPTRQDNGYRDYSEEDLAELKKIKLLRSLELPLEGVRQAQMGQRPLESLLAEQLPRLQTEAARLESAGAVCDEMRRDGVEYATLDAQRYLDALTRTAPPEGDTLPKLCVPWRRYFARALDYRICITLFFAPFGLFTTENLMHMAQTPGWSLLGSVVALIGMVLLEPVLLHRFGTTPGKWVLGLSVTNQEDGRLTMQEARERTLDVLHRGEGFLIPIWGLYRNWKCYRACMEGETLPWEWESTLVLKDKRPWRIVVYVATEVLLIGALVVIAMCQAVPRNRGELSVADFAENFNRLAVLEDVAWDMRLDAQGRWTDEAVPPGSIVVHMGDQDYPDWDYTVEDGRVTGVRFVLEETGTKIWVDACLDQRVLGTIAFVRANAPMFHVGDKTRQLLREMIEAPFEPVDTVVNGVRVRSQVESEGVLLSDDLGMGFPMEDGTEGYFRLEFSMELVS